MRVDAWVKPFFAITYTAFQRAKNNTIWYKIEVVTQHGRKTYTENSR